MPDLRLEQILVRAGSVLDGTTVAAASAAYREATILAIKRANREPIAYPDPEIGLAAGDRVVVLGSPPTLNAMGRQRLPGGRAQEAPDDQEGRRRSVG